MAKRRDRTEQGEVLAGSGKLTDALGYAFRDPALLRLALTHRSFVYEAGAFDAVTDPPASSQDRSSSNGHGADQRNAPGTDNEQLEFLGDAILGFVITDLLYREFPDRSEGELTRMRAFLVSRERLATLGATLGLAPHLLLGRSAEANAAREKPAVIADGVEAVLAAMYLDAREASADVESDTSSEPIAVVRTLVREKLLEPALDELREALRQDSGRGAFRDFKTLLQERVQAESAGRLSYVDVAAEGPPHQRRFTVEARLQTETANAVLATAEGASKKEAQQRAAEGALAVWAVSPRGVHATAAGGREA